MLSTDSLREILGGRARNQLRLARLLQYTPAFRLLLSDDMAQNVKAVVGIMDQTERVPSLTGRSANGL